MVRNPKETINKEIYYYLNSFYDYSPLNLRRLDKGFLNYAGFVHKNAATALEIPFNETQGVGVVLEMVNCSPEHH